MKSCSSDVNSGSMEGFGRIESTIHKGVRWSPSQAYLQPALARNNLHVLCNALVSKVVIQNSYASGFLLLFFIEDLDPISKVGRFQVFNILIKHLETRDQLMSKEKSFYAEALS